MEGPLTMSGRKLERMPSVHERALGAQAFVLTKPPEQPRVRWRRPADPTLRVSAAVRFVCHLHGDGARRIKKCFRNLKR